MSFFLFLCELFKSKENSFSLSPSLQTKTKLKTQKNHSTLLLPGTATKLAAQVSVSP